MHEHIHVHIYIQHSREHIQTPSRHGMSRELRFRAATACSTTTLSGRRCVLWPHSTAMGRGKPEMGQSRTTRRIDSYDSARCFITARAAAGVVINVCGIGKKSPFFCSLSRSLSFSLLSFSLFRFSFPPSLSRSLGLRLSVSLSRPLFFSRGHAIRLFCSCARKPAAALFFSNNGAIFGAAEMEIYLITDTRARYGCGGPDMRFVLSDVDYALMEYYRYASRILRNGRVCAP